MHHALQMTRVCLLVWLPALITANDVSLYQRGLYIFMNRAFARNPEINIWIAIVPEQSGHLYERRENFIDSHRLDQNPTLENQIGFLPSYLQRQLEGRCMEEEGLRIPSLPELAGGCDGKRLICWIRLWKMLSLISYSVCGTQWGVGVLRMPGVSTTRMMEVGCGLDLFGESFLLRVRFWIQSIDKVINQSLLHWNRGILNYAGLLSLP